MMRVFWSGVVLLAAAAVGCAGTIDRPADFEDDRRENNLPVPPTNDRAGASSPAPQQDAGTAPRPNTGLKVDDPADSADSGPGPVTPRGDDDKPNSSPPPTEEEEEACDFRGLIQMKCGNMNCHGAPATSTGLDLTSASLATRVADRKGNGECSDNLLIDRDNPEQSVLYQKITGTSCGVRMPLGGTLSSNEQKCVLSWISSLAPVQSSPPAARDAGADKADDEPKKEDPPPADAGSATPDSGSSANANPQPPRASCDFTGLVQRKCGNSSCHGAPALGTGLDLTSASPGTRLEGRTGATACTDTLLIDKDNPEESMLYLKVTGSSCGTRMPIGGSLTPDEQQCFLTWIQGL